MSKPSVAFAERVTAFPPSPDVSAVSATARRAPRTTSTRSSTINSMLIGLMGIIFGLGIMYLLSRVMHTTRRLTILERQAKQQYVRTDEVEAQMELMHMALSTVSVQNSKPAPVARASPPAVPVPTHSVTNSTGNTASESKDVPLNLPVPVGFPPVTWLEFSPDMLGGINMTDLLFGMSGDAGVEKRLRVEEVVEEVCEEVKPTPEKRDQEDVVPASIEPDTTNKTTNEGNTSGSEDSEDEAPVHSKPMTRKVAGGRGGRGAGRGRKAA